MTFNRSDLDQAARYIRYACELLEREPFADRRRQRKVSRSFATGAAFDDFATGLTGKDLILQG